MMEQPVSFHAAMPRKVLLLLLALTGCCLAALLLAGSIPQDPQYHNFADQRVVFQVINFWNVVSNLPLVLVSLAGLCRSTSLLGKENGTTTYLVLFAGALLTGFGSAYYHSQPDNWGLLWDRLAMAVTFMAFLAVIIGEFVSSQLAGKLLAPLVLFGLFSVGYWYGTEVIGAGDLRLYILTQFLPMLLIPGIALFRKSAAIRSLDIALIGAAYGLAKLFELHDNFFYTLTTVSGHTLKHFAAAFSVYWVLHILDRKLALKWRKS